jgi:hypothetical protein
MALKVENRLIEVEKHLFKSKPQHRRKVRWPEQ